MSNALSPVVLSSPGALVASIPYILGFTPSMSIVAVWIKDGSVLLTQRADTEPTLADPRAFYGPADQQNPDEVVLVTYGKIDRQKAIDFSDTFPTHVKDFLWVKDGRWASLMCDDPECCPPQGRDIDTSVPPEFVIEGVAPLLDREQLKNDCRPVGTVRLDPTRLNEEERDQYLSRLAKAMSRAPRTAPVLRELGCALFDIRVRDTVLWEAVRTDKQQKAYDLFSAICRTLHPQDVAPAATCAAISAWQLGDGARALVALDFAQEADPDYGLANLVRLSLSSGLHPSAWTESMQALTRDACRYGTGGSK